MKIIAVHFCGILGVALLINPATASADAAPPQPRFRPASPPPSPTINQATTTQARLDALQRDLSRAVALLQKATPGNYGGHWEEAVRDMQKALADATGAADYVKTHPEINPLPIGPSPEDILSVNPAIIPSANRVPGLNMIATIDALNASLSDLTNNLPNNTSGPMLGDIGGYRAKIVTDIGKASADVLAAIAYSNWMAGEPPRGGRATARGQSAPPAPLLEATTQSHLDASRRALNLALTALHSVSVGNRSATSRFGGHEDSAAAAVERALDDLPEAAAYVKAHPEINPLQNGPIPATTSSSHFAVAPTTFTNARAASSAQNMINVLALLNDALGPLLNNPASDYNGPILGDIGGYRAKIMDDIDQAAKEVLAGIDYANGNRGGTGANPAPAAKPPNADGGGATFNYQPATGDGSGYGGSAPTAIAGLALSLAFSLGGLHFITKKRSSK